MTVYAERIVAFGSGLFGVLTEPAGERAGRKPVIVVWNVGLNHKVGPYRFWVTLARSLAARGFSTLRFDLAGLGDSPPRDSSASDLERAVVELRQAVDFVDTELGRKIVLLSNCSGTDNAIVVAEEDPRVVGALFLDGYTYETSRSRLHWNVFRFLEPARYRREARQRFPKLLLRHVNETDQSGPSEAVPLYTREYPSVERFEKAVGSIIARGAKLFFSFSSETQYFYSTQFFDWFRGSFRGRVDVRHWPRASHTFTGVEERAEAMRALEEFITNNFSS